MISILFREGIMMIRDFVVPNCRMFAKVVRGYYSILGTIMRKMVSMYGMIRRDSYRK